MSRYFDLEDILSGDGDRARRYHGLYAATVLGVDDADGLGQIQIAVPSIFDNDGQDAAVWARPCFPAHHFTVPAVGDRVWVMFENGDPAHPVWIGTWYATGTTPPAASPADKPQNRQVIQSPKGQLIVIDDTDGAEQICIQDKTGNRVELRADGVLLKCTQDLTIDASGHNVIIKATSVDVQKA
jgi:uncharacterized protein involved in type VI secretion and phage assembly